MLLESVGFDANVRALLINGLSKEAAENYVSRFIPRGCNGDQFIAWKCAQFDWSIAKTATQLGIGQHRIRAALKRSGNTQRERTKRTAKEAWKLRESGWNHAQIARKYGVTVSAVGQWFLRYGYEQKGVRKTGVKTTKTTPAIAS